MPGALDSEGVYLHAEDDLAAPGVGFSEMLNKPGVSISTQLGIIRDDIDELSGGVSTRRFPLAFTHTGALTVKQGRPFRNNSGRTLYVDSVHVNLETGSSSGAALFDVEVNGTSILSAQISMGVSVVDADATPSSPAWSDGTDLTVDVDAIGTGTAGLTVSIWAH